MKRSGNHALIYWLINSLEENDTNLVSVSKNGPLKASENGNVAFLNDVTIKNYIKTILCDRKHIKRSKIFIISAEDKRIDFAKKIGIYKNITPIFVFRPTLQIMASRFHRLNKRASNGKGSHLGMEPSFFKILRKNLTESNKDGFIWNYNKWYSDALWRKEFLESLGLEYDILPKMSKEGGGSSFTGQSSEFNMYDMNNRHLEVCPKNDWVCFIKEAASQNPDIFSSSEHKEISAL